ncbi:hypothetical protein BDV34DRAFT_60261 [Aspergillus parasiticus]|uniref:Uncharacterized protein n=1 Tax=Aspergillus parasiticus TaxID=5067 RepID=A0A5N6DST9_ASPPA|nr:hypothetical protein BDV34DRAFT_60261 [Aspergillus parasiticus]
MISTTSEKGRETKGISHQESRSSLSRRKSLGKRVRAIFLFAGWVANGLPDAVLYITCMSTVPNRRIAP